MSKKKKGIIAIGVLMVMVIIAVVAIPSKFERVKHECVKIAGSVTSGGSDSRYFIIETMPDYLANMQMNDAVSEITLRNHQESALEAIRYANNELGFPGSVYSDMLHTSALMGRQRSENKKYEVSWTFHPDEGLKVTYTQK